MISKEQLLDKSPIMYRNFLSSSPELFAITLYEWLDDLLKQQQTLELLDAYAIKERKKDPHLTSFIEAEKALLETLEAIIDAIVIYYAQKEVTPSDVFIQELIEAKNKNIHFAPLSTEEHISLLCKNSQVSRVIYKKDLPNTIEIDQEPIPILIQFISLTLQYLMEVEGKKIIQEIQQLLSTLTFQTQNSHITLRNITPEGLEKAYEQIKNFINTKKILNQNIRKHLDDYNKHRNKNDTILHQNSSLTTILTLLNQENLCTAHHLQFVKQFAAVDENGNIIGLSATTLIHHWQAKRNDLEQTQASSFWYGWKELKNFNKNYKDFNVLRLEILKNGALLEGWHLCEAKKKIDEIAIGKQNLYMKNLERYAERVFYATQSLSLSTNSTSSNKQNKETPPNESKNLIKFIAWLDEKKQKLFLSENDGDATDFNSSSSIKFRKHHHQGNETLQLRILILLYLFPEGLFIQQFAQLFKKTDKQPILDAYPKINKKLEHYIILENEKLRLNNSRYMTTCQFNPKDIIKEFDIDMDYLNNLLQQHSS